MVSLYFPSVLGDPMNVSPASACSLGVELAALNNTAPATGTWPSANRMIFIPFRLRMPMLVTRVGWMNGTVTASNAKIMVYTGGGTLLNSGQAGTAKSGNSAAQDIDVTDFVVPAGLNYLAPVADGTGSWFRWATSDVSTMKAMGIAQQASAYASPPNPFTLAAAASNYIPVCWISGSTIDN